MYQPKRDNRFHYVWQVMSFVEDEQCEKCVFRSDRPEYAMCGEVEAKLIAEEPVEELDDVGEYGVVCTRFVEAQGCLPNHRDFAFNDPNHPRLF